MEARQPESHEFIAVANITWIGRQELSELAILKEQDDYYFDEK